MTALDLDAIRERWEFAQAAGVNSGAMRDIAALLAEIERLRWIEDGARAVRDRILDGQDMDDRCVEFHDLDDALDAYDEKGE